MENIELKCLISILEKSFNDVFKSSNFKNLKFDFPEDVHDLENRIFERKYDIIVFDEQQFQTVFKNNDNKSETAFVFVSDGENISLLKELIESGVNYILFLPIRVLQFESIISEIVTIFSLKQRSKEQEKSLALAMKQINMSHIELNLIMSSISDGLYSFIVDDNGKISQKYISPVVEELTGRPFDELKGLDNY